MQKRGWVRIIGGQWRGKQLPVPVIPGLRPTPDRVRETLFNWLSQTIVGARCLDLFAGTGALGFEALSRGAAYVQMVDQSMEVVKHLQAILAQLGANEVALSRAELPHQLKKIAPPFDIVFLDPPYRHNLLLPCCYYLEEEQFLSSSAYIYFEAERSIKATELPATWELIKSKKAGQVAYHLAKRHIGHREKTS